MRVDYYCETSERRDAIDQRWYKFLNACDINPVLLPNDEISLGYLDKVSGIILSGGNSLKVLEGNAPERDNVEEKLIKSAIELKLPIFGVCRGMQVIQNYFSIPLYAIPNHIGKRHDVEFNNWTLNTNSYHQYGTIDSVDEMIVQAKAEDGVIESIRHRTLPIQGIMWHPEREFEFSEFDKQLFKDHFNA